MAKADDSDKNCFCGGLAKFSEMLISVEALLCDAQGQDRDGAGKLFGAGSWSAMVKWSGGLWDGAKSKPSTSTKSSTLRPTTASSSSVTVGANSATANTLRA